jgi:hypothetical protein
MEITRNLIRLLKSFKFKPVKKCHWVMELEDGSWIDVDYSMKDREICVMADVKKMPLGIHTDEFLITDLYNLGKWIKTIIALTKTKKRGTGGYVNGIY